MAETIRDRATILANFADNISGNISPEELRDFVVSAHGVYGGLYLSNNTVPQAINATPSDVIFGANFSSDGVSPNFTLGRITLNAAQGVYFATFSGSFTVSAAADVAFRCALDGISVVGSIVDVYNNATDLSNISLSAIFTSSASQQLSITTSCAASVDLTLKNAQFIVKRIA
jgi:hypothetical protein